MCLMSVWNIVCSRDGQTHTIAPRERHHSFDCPCADVLPTDSDETASKQLGKHRKSCDAISSSFFHGYRLCYYFAIPFYFLFIFTVSWFFSALSFSLSLAFLAFFILSYGLAGFIWNAVGTPYLFRAHQSRWPPHLWVWIMSSYFQSHRIVIVLLFYSSNAGCTNQTETAQKREQNVDFRRKANCERFIHGAFFYGSLLFLFVHT